MVVADLRAMAGALALGEARLAELIDQIGPQPFHSYIRDVQDYAESRARAVLRRIPDGSYEFWDYMDDDMVSRIPVRIRLKMTVNDGHVTLDVSGTDPQVKTAYNVPSAGQRMYWLTFRLTGFITTHDPDIPKNAGIYRNISMINPPGTVLNAEFPDAVNLRVAAPYRLFDATGGALIQAVPELMPAAPGGTMVPFSFAEVMDDGSRRVEVVQPMRSGMGALNGRDGVDARDNSLNNMRNHPVETVEVESAVLITEYDIRPDSGGAGRWRGGVGQMITIRSSVDGGVVLARGMERLRFPPWGIFGGDAGATLQAVLNKGKSGERPVPKIHELVLDRGDTLTLLMPGGGGYGDPFLRDPAAVREDVLDGFVTRDGAWRDYGVALNADFTIDLAATLVRRDARGPLPVQPFTFGRFRLLWEAVFDDAFMLDMNRRLYALRKPSRHTIRRRIFERILPALADGNADLNAALEQTESLRRHAVQVLDDILPLTAEIA
nr:hydantoinase B/oxoprolinase family protein [Ketogulonicigenium vulgare]